MNWEEISSVATVLSTLIILISLGFLWWQLREVQRATHAQSYFSILNSLQDREIREARGRVFTLAGKELKEWNSDDIKIAEIVCSSYDVVGILVRHKMVTETIIIDSWGDSLRKLWPILQPLVGKYRTERGVPEFWDDFESLANHAFTKQENKYIKKRVK